MYIKSDEELCRRGPQATNPDANIDPNSANGETRGGERFSPYLHF